MRERLDHLRTMLMREPRGHFDMYGALLVDPDLPEADLAVLFMHNEGRGERGREGEWSPVGGRVVQEVTFAGPPPHLHYITLHVHSVIEQVQ